MLDVHPPHESVHTWRDFFIHIATIVVGLLIAIGLEQTVESLHHRDQRNRLLGQLDTEHRQTLKDAEDTSAELEVFLDWYSLHIEALDSVLSQHQPYQAPPLPPLGRASAPEDPVWRAAKASGLTSLLSQQALIANSEVGDEVDYIEEKRADVSHLHETSFTLACGRLPLQRGTLKPDYDHADAHDLRDCLAATMAYYSACRTLFIRDASLIGAEKAILAGETNIDRLSNKESEEVRARQAKLRPTPIP